MTTFLDRVRARAGIAARATVVTDNSVPTASGLASSASGFAALALAATGAAGLDAGAGRAVRAGAPRLGLGGPLHLRRLRRDVPRRARRRQRRGGASAGRRRRLERPPGRGDHRGRGRRRSGRRPPCGAPPRPRPTTRPGSAASTEIWRPRAPPSPGVTWRRWVRSPSGAPCACTPAPWPPIRPSSTGTPRPSPPWPASARCAPRERPRSSPSTRGRTSRCCATRARPRPSRRRWRETPGVLRTLIAAPGPGARLEEAA